MTGMDHDEDPALESALQSLSLAARPLGPAFTLRVLAALPARPSVVPGVPASLGLAGWWRRQAAALALGSSGLLVMLASGDPLSLLDGWQQQAGDWVGRAATTDAESVSSLLASFPAGTGMPESYLGVVTGAFLLAAGAGAFLLRAWPANEPGAAGTSLAVAGPAGRA
jgi:hypothetical protein